MERLILRIPKLMKYLHLASSKCFRKNEAFEITGIEESLEEGRWKSKSLAWFTCNLQSIIVARTIDMDTITTGVSAMMRREVGEDREDVYGIVKDYGITDWRHIA
ncbi:hypothetical protein M9H77_14729 [Catharanthus roseus]|uniref:Uncharacterized protein n=1 Tax=Catharanthus roseus TaxID=4058 RepID=A0ACC0BNY4_CATRO|nr:hypothetical protein M9H77_14729 [Catharanthus roseus]